MKLNEGTKVSTDLKTILSIVAGVAIGVWVYFGIEERLNRLETADTLFAADLLKKAEQEPKNLEMLMLIEHLAGEVESIEKEIEASRYNKVNIDHLKEQVDILNKQIEKLRNGNH
jgi:polyhydroxyalkanoate synthesis regulator phasin